VSSQNRPTGRRIAAVVPTGRLTPAVALAIAAPVVTLLAVLVQAPSDPQSVVPPEPASREPLVSQRIGCPAAASGSGPVVLASAAEDDADGNVAVLRAGRRGAGSDVRISPGASTRVAEPQGDVIVSATRGLAAGLFGARVGTRSAEECAAPQGEAWFVGAGAGGEHLSRITLVNPDAGSAVADLVLWGSDGQLEATSTLGITVPGGGSRTLDLEQSAPHRDEVAVRVVVSRGRLVASASDRFATGVGSASRDGLPATAAPAESLVVPAMPRKADSRALTVVNPGEDAARVSVEIVGARSTFAPVGMEEISVPAGRAVTTDLTEALVAAGDEDASIRVTANVPVAAGLRNVVSGDLVHQPAVPHDSGAAGAVVPPGSQRALVLTGGDVAGLAEVTFVGGDGDGTRVRLKPGISVSVPVPGSATAVLVRAEVEYAGAVRVTGPGATLLPLRPLVTDKLVPSVRPAWPPARD
jgi:hypothetical protein